MSDKHEFALYIPDLTNQIDKVLVIQDKHFVRRIGSVLRLQKDDTCIFFDAHKHAEIVIAQIDKKKVEYRVAKVQDNIYFSPEITILLPLLKRDALEDALYACVELGANTVQLVFTEKVHRSWGGQKELERLQRIIIAATEQSKNFALPVLHEPVQLDALSFNAADTHILFEPSGRSLPEVLNAVQKPKKLFLAIGPEADLSQNEKNFLIKNGFIFCKLTPTILRARQAVTLGLGIFRSFF